MPLASVRGEEPAVLANHYSLVLSLRLETEAAQVVPVGSKKYVAPAGVALEATARLAIAQKLWASADRAQEFREVKIEEVKIEPAAPGSSQAEALRGAFNQTLSAWQKLEGQTFRTSRAAGTRAWPPGLQLELGEEEPTYLTAWLAEALQTVPMANIPVRERAWRRVRTQLERLEQKSELQELGRESVRGETASIWMATLSLSGEEPSGELPPGLREQGVHVVLSFHAEDQDTISAEDGRLLRAARSASRERRWLVRQKSGAEAPTFRARLTATLTIEEAE